MRYQIPGLDEFVEISVHQPIRNWHVTSDPPLYTFKIDVQSRQADHGILLEFQ